MQLKSLLLALACFFITNLSAQYLDTRIGQVSRTQVIERGGPDPRLKPFTTVLPPGILRQTA
ncbi:MAG: hypothetical protein R2778_18975 [Saprospiraceae bacterium]